ncbi:MAG TPA: 2'-5' RNA ligase family protein [Actinoplanes sp.]|nr:2'-5' RNA ligase family protein [Actinoplanes sp.]
MTYTVELLLDDGLEQHVRGLWSRLRDAGLPSLAEHPHPTNRPHLTVVTTASLAGLQPLPLPIPAEFGAVRMLGRALVLGVTANAPLRDLYQQVVSALEDPEPWPARERWVPHVSLALRMPEDRRAAALDLFAAEPMTRGRFVTARSYDSRTRTVTELAPAPVTDGGTAVQDR